MSQNQEGTKITRRGFLATTVAVVVASCVPPEQNTEPIEQTPIPENSNKMKKIIATKNAPSAIGPYSQAVMINGFLYTSGQIAINPASGELVMDNIQNETHQVMKNLQALLSEAGMDFSNVIKTGIFLQRMDDFATVNEVYASYFTSDFPARETVEVAKLPKGANIEISMIAFKG